MYKRQLHVHAGILPGWSAKEALRRAQVIEEGLRGPDWTALLERRGRPPGDLDVFTRVRMVDDRGEPDYEYKGPSDRAPRGLAPWFEGISRRALGRRVVFGHWSALGLIVLPNYVSLDTGCVWGRQLTAVRLHKRLPRVIQVPGQR